MLFVLFLMNLCIYSCLLKLKHNRLRVFCSSIIIYSFSLFTLMKIAFIHSILCFIGFRFTLSYSK